MADITIDPENKNPEELQAQGIRAYLISNYSAAVQALSLASELLAAKHGDNHDSLGDVYLYYGKSLLELSREEVEPLGDAVAKKIDEDSESSEDAAEEESKQVEESKEAEEKTEDGNKENDEGKEEKDEEKGETKESDEAEKPVNGDVVNGGPSGSGSGDQKIDGDSTEEKEEEEPSDLQVAWEVLELAKLIYENRGEKGKDKLAETLVVLGEVSLESENFSSAVDDIKKGLEIFKSIPETDVRILAETHYKLGIALSTNSQINEAIESFNESMEILKKRIKELKEEDEEKNKNEIAQMQGLLPEIVEKIADMKNSMEEVRDTCSCLEIAECLREKCKLLNQHE